jgi:two-component system, OmpR family, sensor kinase
MKFFQSIRFRLQLWYGVLLIALLGGFGFTAYRLENSRQNRAIDDELQLRLPVLVESQRPVEGAPQTRVFSLSQKDARLFDQRGDKSIYYVVWLSHGETPVNRSATAPAVVPLPKLGEPPNRLRGDLRETFLFPGPGDCVLVGRSIRSDLNGLHQFGWWLSVVGAAVLVIGLAGGGWLVMRALRPIQAISSAAEKIALGDLSERIHSGEEVSELGQLATVLNATFSRLDAAFTRQARFTADAAHELRTPLAVMLTHTQTSLAGDDLTEEHRDAFGACQRAAQRMRRLTESLLTLARLDSGEAAAVAPTACVLGPVVRDAIELLRPLAETQHVAFISDLSSSRCIIANAEQIGQVVINLVSNAIYYNRPGGEVKVTLLDKSEWVVLTVSDNGQGIAEDDIPHVFDRFYRADRSRSCAVGGAGLGLSISKAIIESHGGTICVTSALGQSTVFTVYLPAQRLQI